MANPTSAFLSAGPSLVPSPVTATTSRFALSLLSMMPFTRVYLSWGDDRANTRRSGHTSSSLFCETFTTNRNHEHVIRQFSLVDFYCFHFILKVSVKIFPVKSKLNHHFLITVNSEMFARTLFSLIFANLLSQEFKVLTNVVLL